MNIFTEIFLASCLPIIYLYNQIFLQIDKGLFGLIPICIGEIFLAIIINNSEKNKHKQNKNVYI